MDCPGCNKPMIDGQVFNGLLKCHWDCQEVVREKMGERNADDLIQLRINARLLQEGIDHNHRLFSQLGGKVL
ncbi:hypothetical protein [Pseudomonas helleri]|uniref:hypothetical protein n=1 Tax=Pseudomonas helleri TaxID=1608996 RepID=UPI0024315AF7|nr:hypothetical protein [Pseudomonas helleri]